MLGPRGKTWRVVVFCLLCLAVLPVASSAASPSDYWPSWIAPVAAEASQSPMEAQLLGDKPFSKDPQLRWTGKTPLAELFPGLLDSQDDGRVLKFPQNVELRISFLYNGDQSALPQDRPFQSHLLFKYSMDYAVLPNLRVGLSGFLYHPKAEESSYFQKRFGDTVLGFGPGVKYDLGRWSFTFQSQVDTGNRDRKEGFQNWFRVWYAF